MQQGETRAEPATLEDDDLPYFQQLEPDGTPVYVDIVCFSCLLYMCVVYVRRRSRTLAGGEAWEEVPANDSAETGASAGQTVSGVP